MQFAEGRAPIVTQKLSIEVQINTPNPGEITDAALFPLNSRFNNSIREESA